MEDRKVFKKSILNHVFFFTVAVVLTVLVIILISPYISIIFAAGIYCILTYPFYRYLKNKYKLKSFVAGIIVFIISVLLIFIPLGIIGFILVVQVIKFINTLTINIDQSLFNNFIININKIFSDLNLQNLQIDPSGLENQLVQSVSQVANILARSLSVVLQVSFASIFTFFVFSILAIVMLPNWRKVVEIIKSFIPLKKDDRDLYFRRGRIIITDVVKGTVIVAMAQGALISLFLTLLGIPNALLFGFLAMVFSLLPVVGTNLVAFPIIIYFFIKGETFNAVSFLVWQLLVVNSIDNILRPFLVSNEVKIHPIIMFFAYLGGIHVFGLAGLILGPLVIVLFITTLEILQKDYLKQNVKFNKQASSNNKNEIRKISDDISIKEGVDNLVEKFRLFIKK
jgi:predicted PurR-regulated permease PerM